MEKRKELGERSRRARGLRGLAVLSALGFAALASSPPARAGDALPPPPPLSIGTADLSVQVVADVPEDGPPDAQPAAPADAPSPAPDPVPADDAVRPVETPAKEAPAVAPPEPSLPAAPAAPAASAPTVSSEPVRAAAPVRPTKKAVPQHRAHASPRQYQQPTPQYQTGPVRSHQATDGHGANAVAPAPTVRPRDIKSEGWNCAENILASSPLCPSDSCQNTSWNCCWIDTCTSGIPAGEEPSAPVVPEPPTQPTPPICTDAGQPGPQYQGGEGQYQPSAGPGEEDSGDEPELDPDPCQQAPVIAPAGDAAPPATGETSDLPDAVQPASSPVVPEPIAVPSQPAGSAGSASSPPPDAQPAEPEPAEPATPSPPSKRTTRVAPAGAILGETVFQARPRPAQVVSSSTPRIKAKPSYVRTHPPAERAVASPARASTPLAARQLSWRLWFVFGAAALLALALSSFALPAQALPHPPTLAGVRARIGSKGLNANAAAAPRRASRGIRYRD